MKLHTDKETINSLSVKHRVNPEVTESIINHCLKSIKECIAMDDMPNILIHNWGRFKPSKPGLDNRFYRALINIKENPDRVDMTALEKMIKVYDRIIVEDSLTSSESADKIREIINSRNEARKE